MSAAHRRRELSIKISIVTVSYNSAATLGDTLRSLAEQRFSDPCEIEHIVIDGGSTDGTLEILAEHRARIAYLISEPDQGVYHAMNKGLALASGEVLGFLNSDDVYADPGVLAAVAAAFAQPEVEVCYGDIVYVDQVEARRVARYWQSSPFVPGLFCRGWVPPHPAFFARTALLKKLGGFDLRYRFAADYELVLRLLEVQRAVSRYLPRVLVRMRLGGISNRNWRNILAGNIETWQALRRNGIAQTPLPVLRKLLSRLPQFFLRPPSL